MSLAIFPAETQAWFDKLAAAQVHQAGGPSLPVGECWYIIEMFLTERQLGIRRDLKKVLINLLE